MATASPTTTDPPTTRRNWLYRTLLIGGLTLFVGGIVGEIYFVTGDFSIQVMNTAPPEEQLVHFICGYGICSGTASVLLGAILWQTIANSKSLAAKWKSFLAALGPEGGHYDGRDKPRRDSKTDRRRDWLP
jgi:hypothetical protein